MPFEVLAHHAVDFWLCGEDLPQPDNRVTLDDDGRIHLALDETNNIAGLKRLQHKLQHMLGHLGMHEHHLLSHSIYLHKSMPIGATAHQAGTVRSATTRRARRWMSTARPTTWTTCTSSTRASSRASGRSIRP
jgi:hypothetical protein